MQWITRDINILDSTSSKARDWCLVIQLFHVDMCTMEITIKSHIDIIV